MSSNSDEEKKREMDDLIRSAREKLIPEKSRAQYLTSYNDFMKWQEEKKITTFTEPTFLAYFSEISKDKAPSTLWSTYSMLKKTIRIYQNVDMNSYTDLVDLLKVISRGFHSKKAKVLTTQDIDKFIKESRDEEFLVIKVAMIFGVQGACRRNELCNITTQDIRDTGSFYVVKVPCTKTNIDRSFVIEGSFYDIVKKYAALRPKNLPINRFFLNYQFGKCTKQVIGLNKFGKMPKIIAEYLKLPEPEKYTGHCFRRSSATILADSGADITTLKRHGGWKSTQVAEGYIEESVENKRRIGNKIANAILQSSNENNNNLPPIKKFISCNATHPETSSSIKENEILSSTDEISLKDCLRVSNCQNITINIYQDTKK